MKKEYNIPNVSVLRFCSQEELTNKWLENGLSATDMVEDEWTD